MKRTHKLSDCLISGLELSPEPPEREGGQLLAKNNFQGTCEEVTCFYGTTQFI